MIIAFTRVKGPGGWMGNMAPYPIQYQGVTARTTEHLFQALRLGLATPAAAEVLAEPSPMGAKLRYKALIKDHPILVEPRSPADVDLMRLCIRLKVEQHRTIRDNLAATGSALLIEDTTSREARGRPDRFWGAALVDGKWEGANWVGVLWMDERARLAAPQESLL